MLSGQSVEERGRGRSNMAAKCARGKVLQDKDIIFVNTTHEGVLFDLQIYKDLFSTPRLNRRNKEGKHVCHSFACKVLKKL